MVIVLFLTIDDVVDLLCYDSAELVSVIYALSFMANYVSNYNLAKSVVNGLVKSWRATTILFIKHVFLNILCQRIFTKTYLYIFQSRCVCLALAIKIFGITTP